MRDMIGRKVAETRKAQKLTQAALAIKCKVNKSIISQIENGRYTGAFYNFELVLNTLGLEFSVGPIERRFPQWDQIETLFAEDDD